MDSITCEIELNRLFTFSPASPTLLVHSSKGKCESHLQGHVVNSCLFELLADPHCLTNLDLPSSLQDARLLQAPSGISEANPTHPSLPPLPILLALFFPSLFTISLISPSFNLDYA